MLYGGESPKPVPPPKQCFAQQSRNFKGPEPYTYGFLAKQLGSNYAIRHRDLERTRVERLRTQYEEDFKSLMRHARHTEMIEVADRKRLYNQIKRMVECEMKANEHLFSEKCTKPELEIKEEPPNHPELAKDLEKQAEELKKQRDEEERKLLEEKRLQLFIENSEELRAAAVAKRKKEIAEINYKTIQEKEKIEYEQKVKKRELANLENSEIIKMQTLEKELEKRRCIEKKQLFRKELYKQVQEKEKNRKKEQENKIIECNDFKKINEKQIEEEEMEKLERIKKQEQRREEIKQFTKERMKLFSNTNEAKSIFDDTFAITMQQNLQDDTADEIKAKIQLRHENEMYIKHHAMIKEERKKLSEAMSQMVLKQINEIDEFKRTLERESAETRRKRAEEGNKVLKEQIKARNLLIEKQKEMKHKLYEQSVREYEEYLKEKKQTCQNKKQYQWQFRKDLNDQIMLRKDIIEKQRKIDMENHKKCMKEIAEQEELLKKLLNKF